MNVWRPKDQIQVKAIGLIRRNEKFLAAEVKRDDGTIKGVRPLGGTLKFGETWQDALKRELKEELGVGLEIKGQPIVLENIFMHEGKPGHEIIFVAKAELPDEVYQRPSPLEFAEDDGTQHKADWFSLSDLAAKGLEIYPCGLADHLEPVAFDRHKPRGKSEH